MGFLNKLFSSEKEESPSKKIKKRTKKKPKKSSSEKSNELLESLDLIIDDAKKMVIKSPKTEILQNEAVSIVEGFFYSNLINNLKGNLIEENIKEYDIKERELKQIQKEFKDIFKKCAFTLESGSNKGQIDYNRYKIFRKNLKQISNGAYKLLIELEEHVNLNSCEEKIENFKKEILNLGKELKIGDVESKDGSLGVSIGFEGDDDEDCESFDFDEEITNYNNFSIDLEEDYDEDIDFTYKNITLEDEKGHFYGSYNQSPNEKYIVAYDEGYLNENDEQTGGQVYLIENQKKILWKKRLERPNAGFVTNNRKVIIIDWTSSNELTGKLLIFSKQGKKVFEQKFESNIGGQDISQDGKELIITTCNPENAFYLFNIENQKLVKKVKNTSGRPETKFNFNEIKKKILKADEFDQQKYDSKKLEQERSIGEEEKRIKELKKKSIKELDYGEVVHLGAIFTGNFYGEKGNPKLAIKYLLEAVKRKKDKPQPYVLKSLGFCYEKLSEFNKAIKYYNLTLERYPPYKKSSPVPDHIDFCKNRLEKNKNFNNNDWTDFICKRREKERR